MREHVVMTTSPAPKNASVTPTSSTRSITGPS